MKQICFFFSKGFLIEFVITFVLVLTVYAAAADDENEVKGSPPLAIGLAITIAHLFAVRISISYNQYLAEKNVKLEIGTI